LSIILTILAGESVKTCRLMGLMAYVFAGVAYEFCGSLRLSTFHGCLQWLTTAAWGSSMEGH